MFEKWFYALAIGLYLGAILGYLLARKTRRDIKQVIEDRRVEEELEAVIVERQIRDAEELEHDGE